MGRPKATETLESRLWARIHKTDACWNWTGALWQGYGAIRGNGRSYMVHRLSYELLIGPIPEGLVIDHLCRNRACVNPDHLEVVTNSENIKRGVGAGALNIGKTHCPQGHEYTSENTIVDMNRGRKGRRCKTCHKAVMHQNYLRKKDKINA